MSNRSYLTVSNRDFIYPSTTDTSFDSEEQVVAQGVYCVPLLWLALFRADNLRTETLTVDEEEVQVIAPIVAVDIACSQLEAAMPLLSQMFSTQHSLPDYVRLLSEAIRSTGLRFVTLESEEIACLGDPESFYSYLRYALAVFSGTAPVPVGRKALLNLSELDANVPFPHATCLKEGLPVTHAQIEAVTRIVGTSWLRPVPWEEDAA
jgi:hypothetical protein